MEGFWECSGSFLASVKLKPQQWHFRTEEKIHKQQTYYCAIAKQHFLMYWVKCAFLCDSVVLAGATFGPHAHGSRCDSSFCLCLVLLEDGKGGKGTAGRLKHDRLLLSSNGEKTEFARDRAEITQVWWAELCVSSHNFWVNHLFCSWIPYILWHSGDFPTFDLNSKNHFILRQGLEFLRLVENPSQRFKIICAQKWPRLIAGGMDSPKTDSSPAVRLCGGRSFCW